VTDEPANQQFLAAAAREIRPALAVGSPGA
jgi:hypothetical protein